MPGRGGPHAYMQGNPMANPMMNPMMMMGGAMGGMMGGFNNNNQPPPPAGRAPGGMGMGGGPQQQPGQPFLPKEIYRHAKTQQVTHAHNISSTEQWLALDSLQPSVVAHPPNYTHTHPS